jgi:hypothetical protein
MPEIARLAALQEIVLAGVLGRRELPREALRALFAAPPAGTLGDRWHIYATGLVARALEAIENDFPALAKVLGPGPLRSLTARYVRRHPPRSYDLGRAGDRLAVFLETDELTADLPFLPDLARLEWALAEAFVAPDRRALRWDDLARLGPEAVADFPLCVRDGIALVRSQWPVREVWACRDLPASEIDVPVVRSPSAVLVSRRGLDLVCRTLDDLTLRLMEAAFAGRRLADLVEDDAQDAQRVVAAFHDLVDDGVFAWPAEGPPPAVATFPSGPRRE